MNPSQKSFTPRTSFFSFTTTRPVAITMVVLAVCVFGWVSYNRLALNLMPDISYPTLSVRTEYPGTAPEEVESTVSRPIEQELGIVNGLVDISSISRAGFSDVILEFTWDTDMDEAAQEIREKLDRVYLPQQTERPLILRYDPSLDPIMRIGIYGDVSLYLLRWMAEEDIKRSLETVPGIAAAKVKGGLEEEILVELSEQELSLLNIGIREVITRLAQENINLAGGNLKEGKTKYIVRTMNEFVAVDEINEIIIGRKGNVDIRIKDIGKVSRTHKEREVITRVNGSECVEVEIYKEADANIVAVAERVRDRLFGTPEQQAYIAQLRAKSTESETRIIAGKMGNFIKNMIPAGVELAVLSDRSIFIRNSITEVRNTAIMGGILAVIVLYFFLRNIAHTLIIGLSIPASLIATFAPMYLGDVSLNLMSLGGIALGIGMLVDNSIVVLESIFRCREEGDSITRAAVRGTGEVGGAVIASTLTSVAVFFPLVFVEGIAGQVFGDMSLTVVFSLLASLFIALTFVPMLASRQFTIGGGTARRHESTAAHSLHLFVISRIKEDFSGSDRVRERDFRGFVKSLNIVPKYIALAVVELLHRLGVSILTIILITLKLIVIPVCIIPLVPLSIIFRFWGKGGKPVDFIFVLSEAKGDSLWRRLRFMPGPGLDFSSLDKLANGVSLLLQWIRRSPFWLILIKALICFIPGLTYFFLRFIVDIFTCFLGKIIWLLIVIIVASVEAAGVIIGLAFYPFLNVSLAGFNAVFHVIQTGYPKLLRTALHNKGTVLISAFAPAVLCWFLLIPNLGRELIPEVRQGEFSLNVHLPVGIPVEETARITEPIERYLLNHSKVERVSSVIGAEKTSTTAADEGEHTSKINVILKPSGSIERDEDAVIREVRSNVREIPGLTSKISRPVLFSFKTPIELEIRGYNLNTLKRLSREVERGLASIPGLYDVRSNIQRGYPEVQIYYNRDYLAHHNLDIRTVANLVQSKIQGSVATRFKEEDRRIDIRVRVREDDKKNVEDLRKLVINPGSAVPLPLEAVSNITVDEGPNEIRRIDQQRVALITANIGGVDLGTVSSRIEKRLRGMTLPPDFAFAISGQNREMETSLNSLVFALLLAVFLIYVVMASQFESLVQPFIIMFSIPLAFIGVIAILYMLHIPVSVVVFIGFIVLAGIVVNNAIVLLDYINFLRKQGMTKIEAIVRAGTIRLRPILMTSMTTILGLFPMALGLGEGAEIRTPMAITVIAGLASSTVLTLIVIPTIYAIVDRRKDA